MNRLDGGEASADLESWLDGGVLSTGDLQKMSQLEGVERHRVAIWGGVGQRVERCRRVSSQWVHGKRSSPVGARCEGLAGWWRGDEPCLWESGC
jgi:hypothetical protein